MKVFISQSNYIPWKGYFDAIHQADVMVIYDCVQYTRRDWRNRNLIRSAEGLLWLSIPVRVHTRSQLINETEVVTTNWVDKHWTSLYHSYVSSPFFDDFQQRVLVLYQEAKELQLLSDINYLFLQRILSILEIKTKLIRAPHVDLSINATQRLVNICKDLGCTTYLTGPSAKNYLEVDRFRKEGIAIEWMNYSNYPTYAQNRPGFEHHVSILDVLFNCGPNARQYVLIE